MKNNFSINPFISSVLCVLTFFCITPSKALAADLDDIYTPLITQGRFLYEFEISNFDMSEEGIHGSSSFSDFESDPALFSLSNSIRFSPLRNFEVVAGYGQYLPQEYTRLTYDGPTLALDTTQEYTLQHFQDYFIDMRLRADNIEPYLTFREKRQKAKADAILLLDNTTSYDDIISHYEDLKVGIRFLSQEEEAQNKSNYSLITRPLLADGQWNMEVGVGFKNGRVKNSSDIYWGVTPYLREYFHQLRPHYIPELLLRYGLSDRIELEGGLAYTTPFKYKYEYKQFNPSNSNFILGTYSIKNDIKVPLKISYRPSDPIAITFSSDFRYTRQRLDAWEKEIDDSITLYDSRDLHAYNTKPTLEITYFHDAGQTLTEDEFSSLTKQLLKHKQFLLRFQYQKDFTSAGRDVINDAQNVIDPYNLFQYPLDLFVSGTEYGTFFLGNKTTRAAELQQQNYYLLETSLTYGLNDFLNAGLEVGYRSGNDLNHFTLHDLSERFYRFEPYYYFNFAADWQVKDNNLISLKAHYVPQYKTFLDASGYASQFEAETQYYTASLSWNVLF